MTKEQDNDELCMNDGDSRIEYRSLNDIRLRKEALRKTIEAVNAKNPHELFDMIKIARFDFIEDICKKRPVNNKFKRGWMNRINDLGFEKST